MRARQKKLGKDKRGNAILEDDGCEYIEVTEKKEYKCLRRSSWKCDGCRRWICSLHFRTLGGKRELCLDCLKKLEKGRRGKK